MQVNHKAINVIQSFIQDMNEAIKDGLTTNELMSMIGAVAECALRSVPKHERLGCWLGINIVMTSVMKGD